jgi:hypothetical protein
MINWIIFIAIGLPLQLILMLFYPVIHVAWRLFIYKDVPIKAKASHEAVSAFAGSETIFNGKLLKNPDDHGAFSMYGFIQGDGLELLQHNGNLLRRLEEDGTRNMNSVSGDVVVAWFFANQLATAKVSDKVLLSVVDNYIKNLGTLSFDSYGDGYVSARCSNFGVNYAKDSTFLLTQPAAGPQYYTTAAVLASAYNKGLKYKIMFWLHWLIMGGWYWAFSPVLYPDYDSLWYVRDITMKSLYVQLQTFGPKWWITVPMKFIADKTMLYENDLFNAMLGRDIGELPESMDSFFSQKKNASSVESDRMSPHIPEAIRKIKRETRFKE